MTGIGPDRRFTAMHKYGSNRGCRGHAAHGGDRWKPRRKLIGISTSRVLAIETRIAVAIVAIEEEAVGIAARSDAGWS